MTFSEAEKTVAEILEPLGNDSWWALVVDRTHFSHKTTTKFSLSFGHTFGIPAFNSDSLPKLVAHLRALVEAELADPEESEIDVVEAA